MKLLIVGDVHWSQNSSIVRKNGDNYSIRLENCIESLNWANSLAETKGCVGIVFLGDFFDKSILNSQEITALKEIKWASMHKYFLIGNHESNVGNLEYSATHLFHLCPNSSVIHEPTVNTIGDTDVVWLPYISESNRLPITDYYKKETNNKTLILSHNDLAGFQYGGFLSTEGFHIKEIYDNCDLFINGHLHNAEQINDKMINIGNLTGQNFSEDAFKYNHNVILMDTDTWKYEFIENPHSMKFYKLTSLSQLNKLRNNAVVSMQVDDDAHAEATKMLRENHNVVESRIILNSKAPTGGLNANQMELTQTDHLQQFKQFVFDNIGMSDVIKEELAAIMGG